LRTQVRLNLAELRDRGGMTGSHALLVSAMPPPGAPLFAFAAPFMCLEDKVLGLGHEWTRGQIRRMLEYEIEGGLPPRFRVLLASFYLAYSRVQIYSKSRLSLE
jgi:hypothetical protein